MIESNKLLQLHLGLYGEGLYKKRQDVLVDGCNKSKFVAKSFAVYTIRTITNVNA